MAEAVEVECTNEECPGRTEAHSRDCICKGTGEVMTAGKIKVISVEEDEVGVRVVGQPPTVPCREEPLDVDVERWTATWRPATRKMPGEWAANIHCPGCSEEGTPVDG